MSKSIPHPLEAPSRRVRFPAASSLRVFTPGTPSSHDRRGRAFSSRPGTDSKADAACRGGSSKGFNG
ncbi:hypothetical protein ColTof4_01995 [Colletotrichum tofieldiae]|nr:hypothetical protein ColTof3_09721 [Colletotrichum tofieldiae]GKT69572.1 hypothetical protein ColTof4_01995 [Colletotrichum tofieldiae]GKT96111.1 hypothetical protein Ct61P_13961 [Colletotrichum tofieldiae]